MFRVTMICHDDDVETAVEANLLQTIHKLTNDPIHPLDCFNQLQETSETHTASISKVSNPFFHRISLQKAPIPPDIT